MPECFFRTVMVRPFLENALLSRKSLLGINYHLWSNTKSDTNCIPLRAFQILFLSLLPISDILSYLGSTCGCMVGKERTLLHCNVIRKQYHLFSQGKCHLQSSHSRSISCTRADATSCSSSVGFSFFFCLLLDSVSAVLNNCGENKKMFVLAVPRGEDILDLGTESIKSTI